MSEIHVCQASTCRSRGSDAVLVEIEELGRLVGRDCDVNASGCLGYCNQGPAAAVVVKTRKSNRRNRNSEKVSYHVRLNSLQKSAALVERATGLRPPLENLPPETEGRFEQMRKEKACEFAIDTYQWNKALKGMESSERRAEILSKAGYPGLDTRMSTASVTLPMPSHIENYVAWTLDKIEVVSSHSAVFCFSTNDFKRGTPHPRGRGKQAKPITWHVTMLGEVGSNDEGPLSWIERDYTPISSAKEWERGQCKILVKIYQDGALTSWLHQSVQPPRKVFLSQPLKTLSVPALTSDEDEAGFTPKSILLLLAGTGIVALPQTLAHRDPVYQLGISTPRKSQLQCPIDAIVSCREDDMLMLTDLKEWCQEHMSNTNAHRYRGLRHLTLLVTQSQEGGGSTPYEYSYDAAATIRSGGDQENHEDDRPLPESLASFPLNTTMLHHQRLNKDIVTTAMSQMDSIRACRVIVSGPDSFNNAARGFLDGLIESDQVTVLSA